MTSPPQLLYPFEAGSELTGFELEQLGLIWASWLWIVAVYIALVAITLFELQQARCVRESLNGSREDVRRLRSNPAATP
jgi:hypothetical protein